MVYYNDEIVDFCEDDHMKNEVKFKGQLKVNMRWSLILSVLWMILAIVLFFIDIKAGLLGVGFLVVYLCGEWIIYNTSKNITVNVPAGSTTFNTLNALTTTNGMPANVTLVEVE